MRFKQLSAQVEEGDSREFMKPGSIALGRLQYPSDRLRSDWRRADRDVEVKMTQKIAVNVFLHVCSGLEPPDSP